MINQFADQANESLNEQFLEIVENIGCIALSASAFVAFQIKNPAQEIRVANVIPNNIACAEYAGSWQERAYSRTLQYISQGMKSGVLPLIDQLNKQLEVVNNSPNAVCSASEAGNGSHYWKSWFTNQISSEIVTLGSLREVRAQSAISNFENFKCTSIANQARKALANIETGIQVKKIHQGDPNAIQWGMDTIRYHDGDYREIHFLILDGFELLMRTHPALKAKLKAFCKEEFEAQYHAYDQELQNRLEKLGKQ